MWHFHASEMRDNLGAAPRRRTGMGVTPLVLEASASAVSARAAKELVGREGICTLTAVKRLVYSQLGSLMPSLPRRENEKAPETRRLLTLNFVKLEERVGFEPTEPLGVQRFSRSPQSATLPPLLDRKRCVRTTSLRGMSYYTGTFANMYRSAYADARRSV